MVLTILVGIAMIVVIVASMCFRSLYLAMRNAVKKFEKMVLLPMPKIHSDVLSVEQALAYRRSIREYMDKPISIE